MKNIFSLFILLFVCNSVLFAQTATILKGNMLVMLQEEKDIPSITRELSYFNGLKTGFQLQRVVSKSMHIYLFTFDFLTINKDAFLSIVRQNPLIKIAQFDHTIQPRATPNDTEFNYLWNMQNTGSNNGIAGADIDALKAWDIATGGLTVDGDTIVVAVIDYGFYLAHTDLNYWKNYQEIPLNGIDDDGNGYIDDVNGWNALTNTDSLPIENHG